MKKTNLGTEFEKSLKLHGKVKETTCKYFANTKSKHRSDPYIICLFITATKLSIINFASKENGEKINLANTAAVRRTKRAMKLSTSCRPIRCGHTRKRFILNVQLFKTIMLLNR